MSLNISIVEVPFVLAVRDEYRYHAVLLRAEIEKTRAETDMRRLGGMLEAAEEECWKQQHPQPFIFKVKPSPSLGLLI